MQLQWSLCDSIQLSVCVALWEDPQLEPSVISQQWKGGHWKRSIFRPFPSFSFSYCASIEISDSSYWQTLLKISKLRSGKNVGRFLFVLVLGLACRHPLFAGRLPSRRHTCKVFSFACFPLETTSCGFCNWWLPSQLRVRYWVQHVHVEGELGGLSQRGGGGSGQRAL